MIKNEKSLPAVISSKHDEKQNHTIYHEIFSSFFIGVLHKYVVVESIFFKILV